MPNTPTTSAGRTTSLLLTGALLCASATAVFSFAQNDATATKPAPVNQPPGEPPPGMVWIPAGEFEMGSTEESTSEVCTIFGPKRDAGPAHRVYIDGFWMDATEVTNEQFTAFVAATGYVTVAERPLSPKDFPGVPAEALVPGSVVFASPDQVTDLNNVRAWWRYVPGANWRHPQGPQSNLAGREKHPVVHVAYEDAVAYATWAGKRLPTEAEWERAARGGREGQLYTWGPELKPDGRWAGNIWQGRFPVRDTAEDGFAGTAPVATYLPNPYGLYDMAGNVWEWCHDWYHHDHYSQVAARGTPARNPTGPADSFDPGEPRLPKRVQRGGSFLCTDQYCSAYTVASRGRGEPSTGTSNVGFRCARSDAR